MNIDAKILNKTLSIKENHLNRCRKKLLIKLNMHLIKTLQKVVIEGTYLNIIKAIYVKPTNNIVLNGEKLKAFHLTSGCPLSPL